ncbi:hypothetical protein AMS62_17225 [Bacillus sp. FJAT-18019]|nr:hypothetical protein AMS62_17225 [Bacillus sp. FJAT-18019]
MSNKKRLAIILSSGVLLCSIAFIIIFTSQPNFSNSEKKPPTAQGSKTEEPETSTPPKKPLSVHASYSDFNVDLEAMKDSAYVIAVGKVVSQHEPSRVAVGSVIQINKVYKGNPQEEIIVTQVGQVNEETVLEPNKTYLLFLGDQEVENTYYVKGGEQGIFLIDNEILKPQDYIMKEDLKKRFNEEVTFNINAKSTSEFEKWLSE